jgi:hypothetical protein
VTHHSSISKILIKVFQVNKMHKIDIDVYIGEGRTVRQSCEGILHQLSASATQKIIAVINDRPYPLPFLRSQMREVEILVVAIDLPEIIHRWCAKNLDDLNQLISRSCSWEDWLPKKQFSQYAAGRPDIFTQQSKQIKSVD